MTLKLTPKIQVVLERPVDSVTIFFFFPVPVKDVTIIVTVNNIFIPTGAHVGPIQKIRVLNPIRTGI